MVCLPLGDPHRPGACSNLSLLAVDCCACACTPCCDSLVPQGKSLRLCIFCQINSRIWTLSPTESRPIKQSLQHNNASHRLVDDNGVLVATEGNFVYAWSIIRWFFSRARAYYLRVLEHACWVPLHARTLLVDFSRKTHHAGRVSVFKDIPHFLSPHHLYGRCITFWGYSRSFRLNSFRFGAILVTTGNTDLRIPEASCVVGRQVFIGPFVGAFCWQLPNYTGYWLLAVLVH